MPSKKEIVDLETSFWNAIRDEDAAAAIKLIHDPCILSGAHGVMALSRDDYSRMAAKPTWKLNSFKLDKVDVQFPGEDVAIIGYVIDEDMIVEGKPLKLTAAETSTWIRKDGEWLCAAHTESILGDPFGRDKEIKKAA